MYSAYTVIWNVAAVDDGEYDRTVTTRNIGTPYTLHHANNYIYQQEKVLQWTKAHVLDF